MLIAKKALERIENNDVIFLSSTTVCYFIAQNLPCDKRVRVVTNSIIIAEELRSKENVSVILLGGEMDKKGNCYDAFAIDIVKKLRIDKSFICSAAISAGFGLSIQSSSAISFFNAVMDSSKKNIGLYPKEKIGFDSIVSICPVKRLDMMITDWDAREEDLKLFREKGIEILVVEEEGKHYVDAYERAWLNKPRSLLTTTQNTRDLGGYRTKDGGLTKEEVILRSDVQNYPSEEDFEYLKAHGITTIIDMRGAKDVARKPSGFAGKEGFDYFNFQIDEGSGVPESVAAVPLSYMDIASAKVMPDVLKCIANAKSGVMFNCTAGKDRTGVVSAILLLHVGVSDKDIIENYVLTKEYGRERLELVHKNFPELDMNIVTPCEMFMEEFLRLFREKYKDTDNYFSSLGLDDEEIQMIRKKLCER